MSESSPKPFQNETAPAQTEIFEAMRQVPCKHCYCRTPKVWMGVGPAPDMCCKCGNERVSNHGKPY